jgi:hypothetical protein
MSALAADRMARPAATIATDQDARAGDADEEIFGALAQHAIQCYTQNQIAGAAQATGGNARAQDMRRKTVQRGIAGRKALENDADFAPFGANLTTASARISPARARSPSAP